MIDIHGLQVGNWLEHKFSFKNYQIEGIHNDLIYIKEVTPGWVHMSAYSPIPLTPEILIALGFKDKNMNIDIWVNGVIHVCRMPLHPGEYYFCMVDGGSLSVIDDSKFKSLHQLQNLYYCLTGEELNYKP